MQVWGLYIQDDSGSFIDISSLADGESFDGYEEEAEGDDLFEFWTESINLNLDASLLETFQLTYKTYNLLYKRNAYLTYYGVKVFSGVIAEISFNRELWELDIEIYSYARIIKELEWPVIITGTPDQDYKNNGVYWQPFQYGVSITQIVDRIVNQANYILSRDGYNFNIVPGKIDVENFPFYTAYSPDRAVLLRGGIVTLQNRRALTLTLSDAIPRYFYLDEARLARFGSNYFLYWRFAEDGARKWYIVQIDLSTGVLIQHANYNLNFLSNLDGLEISGVENSKSIISNTNPKGDIEPFVAEIIKKAETYGRVYAIISDTKRHLDNNDIPDVPPGGIYATSQRSAVEWYFVHFSESQNDVFFYRYGDDTPRPGNKVTFGERLVDLAKMTNSVVFITPDGKINYQGRKGLSGLGTVKPDTFESTVERKTNKFEIPAAYLVTDAVKSAVENYYNQYLLGDFFVNTIEVSRDSFDKTQYPLMLKRLTIGGNIFSGGFIKKINYGEDILTITTEAKAGDDYINPYDVDRRKFQMEITI